MPASTLPIIATVENWDCHSCGICCRGTTIPLDEDDVAKIRKQKWDQTPELAKEKLVVRSTLMAGKRVLGKQANGDCVFLNDKNRCRIHEKFGRDAKPAVCRMFPFQVVPTENATRLTTRRSCPSAAEDRGSLIAEHSSELKQSGLLRKFAEELPNEPPPVAKGAPVDWNQFTAASDALERILADEAMPLVRRLVHTVLFCDLLSECKLTQVTTDSLAELVEVLEESSQQTVGEWFRDRQPASRTAQSLLRQSGLHFLRCHPKAVSSDSLGARLKSSLHSLAFARGKGKVPQISHEFPATTFSEIDRPLGALPAEVMQPLTRYFETQVTSRFFAFRNHHRPLIDSFYCLALTFPLALWMLRLMATGGEPSRSQMVEIVVAMERGQGMPAFATLAKSIARTRELPRLIAWYAR